MGALLLAGCAGDAAGPDETQQGRPVTSMTAPARFVVGIADTAHASCASSSTLLAHHWDPAPTRGTGTMIVATVPQPAKNFVFVGDLLVLNVQRTVPWIAAYRLDDPAREATSDGD